LAQDQAAEQHVNLARTFTHNEVSTGPAGTSQPPSTAKIINTQHSTAQHSTAQHSTAQLARLGHIEGGCESVTCNSNSHLQATVKPLPSFQSYSTEQSMDCSPLYCHCTAITQTQQAQQQKQQQTDPTSTPTRNQSSHPANIPASMKQAQYEKCLLLPSFPATHNKQ
jgi:hypothetical protein